MKRKDKNKSANAVAQHPSPRVQSLPELDFSGGESGKITHNPSVFLPMHFEKKYAYPLVVWLPGSTNRSRQLSRIMPKVSLRNYIGVTPDLSGGSKTDLDSLIFSCLEKASLRFNINEERIFIAGCGVGGCQALKTGIQHSDYFSGAISLGGSLPVQSSLLAEVRSARNLPLFISQSRNDSFYVEDEFCDDLKLFHVSGFSVTARQYPGDQQLNEQMLHDIDVWMMEIINGFDMTKTENPISEKN